ncbi:hypothetical protein COBT_001570, partial [Conglomerata obtusa]
MQYLVSASGIINGKEFDRCSMSSFAEKADKYQKKAEQYEKQANNSSLTGMQRHEAEKW